MNKVLLGHSHVDLFTYCLWLLSFILQHRVELLHRRYGLQSIKGSLSSNLQKKVCQPLLTGHDLSSLLPFFSLLFCSSHADSLLFYTCSCYSAILYAVSFCPWILLPSISYAFLSHITLESVTFSKRSSSIISQNIALL